MRAVRSAIDRRLARFETWRRSPASRADRVAGACVGALGGLWIGILATVMWVSPPVVPSTVGLGGLGGAVFDVALGLRYPKGAAILLFPFSIFGIGVS